MSHLTPKKPRCYPHIATDNWEAWLDSYNLNRIPMQIQPTNLIPPDSHTLGMTASFNLIDPLDPEQSQE